jgi:uncharacterized metal-binding protein
MAKKIPSTPDFTLDIDGVRGLCPSGEKFAQEQMDAGKTPVLSCEGPCIRGELARLVANNLAENEPYARTCYAESFLVPHSKMAKWVKEADRVVMIDGCFLKCLGRVLNNFIDEEKIDHIDILPLHNKFGDTFLYTDVPEAERIELARQVTDKVLNTLQKKNASEKIAAQ